MVCGNSAWQWDQPYDYDIPRPPNTSFHLGGRPYSELVGKNFKKCQLSRKKMDSTIQ